MNIPAPASPASRLCAACGMCCNGVLFEIVVLGPNDSPKKLATLGPRLKHKKKKDFIQQPCPAYKGSQCCVYEDRPERCRKFECRQLVAMNKGEITEAQALEKIHAALARVSHIEQLLRIAGESNPGRPLTKRYDRIMEQTGHESHEPGTALLRGQLTQAMEELEAMLKEDFRTAT